MRRVGGGRRESFRLGRTGDRQPGGEQAGWRRPRPVSRLLPLAFGSEWGGSAADSGRRLRMRLCFARCREDAEAQMRCWLRARQRRSIQEAMAALGAGGYARSERSGERGASSVFMAHQSRASTLAEKWKCFLSFLSLQVRLRVPGVMRLTPRYCLAGVTAKRYLLRSDFIC